MRIFVVVVLCGLTLMVSFFGLMTVCTWWVSHHGGNRGQAEIGLAMIAAPISLAITVAVGLVLLLRGGPKQN